MQLTLDGATRRTAAPVHRLVGDGQHHRRVDARRRTRQARRPLRKLAEEPDLIHGLIGSDVEELRWAVGAHHEQRDPFQGCFDHRRSDVGERAA